MNKGLKPRFCREQIGLLRKEKDGFYLVKPINHPETGDIIINSSSYNFLDRCNGENTIENILNEFLQMYKNVDIKILEEDFTNVLSRFSYLNLINWQENQNPFVVNYEQKIQGKIYKVAEDQDTQKVANFISDNLNNASLSSIIRRDNAYSELAIRSKIFQKVEEFFYSCDEKNNIENLISIEMPHYENVVRANIMYVANEKNVFELLTFAINAMQDISIFPIKKVVYVLNEKLSSELSNLLEKANFYLEAKLENETKDNKIHFLWSCNI